MMLEKHLKRAKTKVKSFDSSSILSVSSFVLNLFSLLSHLRSPLHDYLPCHSLGTQHHQNKELRKPSVHSTPTSACHHTAVKQLPFLSRTGPPEGGAAIDSHLLLHQLEQQANVNIRFPLLPSRNRGYERILEYSVFTNSLQRVAEASSNIALVEFRIQLLFKSMASQSQQPQSPQQPPQQPQPTIQERFVKEMKGR